MKKSSASKALLGLSVACCIPGTVTAVTPSPPELKRVSYHSDATGLERDYYVYLPAGFAQQDHWPVLMFLQGGGERGNGKDELDWLLVSGPLFEAWSQQRQLPFVIVVPQLPIFHQGKQGYITNRTKDRIRYPRPEGRYPEQPPGAYRGQVKLDGQLSNPEMPFGLDGPEEGWSMIEHELLAMIDRTLADFKGDPDRVYLTGLSTGGFGTWYMAGQHPGRFAAIAPISGFPHPDLIPAIARAKLPVWCFTGGRDPYFKVQNFYPGLNLLEELGHPEVRFTIYSDLAHDAWHRAYAGQDLYDWLLRQKRSTGQ